jgi:hypothetical protein
MLSKEENNEKDLTDSLYVAKIAQLLLDVEVEAETSHLRDITILTRQPKILLKKLAKQSLALALS